MLNLRKAGAAAVLVQGAVHLQQYLDGFSAIPVIGALFLLNAVSSVGVAFWILKSDGLAPLAAGVSLVLGSLASLFLTGTIGLFGYVSSGYGVSEILALTFEAIGVVSLGMVAVSLQRTPATA
ncbi:MAG: hypothetical protein H0U53_10060 [Actinobacteria bacterium]|nr:hypothetical protein [Actinomycetota bacterium]